MPWNWRSRPRCDQESDEAPDRFATGATAVRPTPDTHLSRFHWYRLANSGGKRSSARDFASDKWLFLLRQHRGAEILIFVCGRPGQFDPLVGRLRGRPRVLSAVAEHFDLLTDRRRNQFSINFVFSTCCERGNEARGRTFPADLSKKTPPCFETSL
jgi:hypothetical protein